MNTIFGLSYLTVGGFIGVIWLSVFFLKRLRNRQLTKYHIPAILLLLLGIAAAFGTVAGYELADREVNGIDYNVQASQPVEEKSSDTQETPSNTQETLTTSVPGIKIGGPYEFDELSSDAQDVFLSTLRNDGTYTTRTSPSEFQDNTADAGGPAFAHIRHNSTWYKITVDAGGGPSIISPLILILFGGFLAGVILEAGWASVLLPSFKFPVSVLIGLIAVVPYIPTDNFLLSLGQLGQIFIGVALVVWIILRLLETQLAESFRERMYPTNGR